MVGTVISGMVCKIDWCCTCDSSSCVHTAGERENVGVLSVSESSDDDNSFDGEG